MVRPNHKPSKITTIILAIILLTKHHAMNKGHMKYRKILITLIQIYALFGHTELAFG